MLMEYPAKKQLLSYFKRAVHVCLPSVCMPGHLKNIDASKGICVLGAGKASAEMAAVMYEAFGDKCFGAVVTRYGQAKHQYTGRIKLLEASHPVPDLGSLQAAKIILELAKNNAPDVPIVFLISGGGSALLSLPVDGITFTDKAEINAFLLKSGASIDEINTVRKQLSQIKGGQLSAIAQSPFTTFIISDVVGDDPGLIASGPTISDTSYPGKALSILEKYHWRPNARIENYLKNSRRTPVVIDDSKVEIIANARMAIDAARGLAESQQWQTRVLNYQQVGEASEVAKIHANLALEAKANGERVILFSGGELTVTLGELSGEGGPNQEYLLALAIELDGAKGISAIACDTDGIDGSKDVAGAFIDEQTLPRAQALRLSPEDYLIKHKSYSFFDELGDLIITGPTHTNVNDFRAIVIC